MHESSAEHVVCHVSAEGDPAGEAVDEILEALAHRYPGTRFLRCAVGPNSALLGRVSLELPAGELYCW